MDGPGRGDHGLLVMQDHVTGFLRFAHHVEDHVLILDVEVEVDLHAALVGVARHGIPVAARGELGHAHAQLAALHDGRMEVLVDDALVAGLGAAQRALIGLVDIHQDVRIGLVRRAGVDVVLGRVRGVDALHLDFLRAHADVQAVVLLEVIHNAVNGDLTLAADVDDAHLAALKERIGAQLLAALELHNGIHRHDAARDDAVKMRIGEHGLVRNEHGLDDILAAQALGAEIIFSAMSHLKLFLTTIGCKKGQTKNDTV